MSLGTQPDGRVEADFAAIFHEHVPYVWRALRRLGVAEADVEDVCQEVFVVVHRKLPEFEGRARLRTWIYGICIRTASDYRRRAHRRHERPTDAVPDPGSPAVQDAEVRRREARAILDAALAELDDAKREVFVLFEIEELTMAEVAEAVGCPVKTAYSRLYAARAQLEAALARRRTEGGSP